MKSSTIPTWCFGPNKEGKSELTPKWGSVLIREKPCITDLSCDLELAHGFVCELGIQASEIV